MINPILKTLTIYIVACLAVGCGPQTLITPTTSISKETKSPTVSQSVTETRQAITPTVVLTSSEIPQLATTTPIPTLISDNITNEIQRLMFNNNECLFPCWWGLTPNETPALDVINYFDAFKAYSIGEPSLGSRQGFLRVILPWQQESHLHLTFIYGNEGEVLDRLWVRVQMLKEVIDSDGRPNYEISWGDPLLSELTAPFNLPEVLSTYGVPDRVLIRTYRAALLNQPLPFSLVIFYPEKGFMIEYVADGRRNLDKIEWCPTLTLPIIWFWSPSNEIDMADIISGIPGELLDSESLNTGRFRSLEEATDMSLEEFYTAFNNNPEKCLESPAGIWPGSGQ